MTTHPALENWLSRFYAELEPLPLSERAELVTELKSHILEKQSANPEKSMDDILSEVGAPRHIAATYTEGVDKEEPKFKKEDQKEEPRGRPFFNIRGDHVELFGGAIEVDGQRGRIRIGDFIDINSSEGKMKVGPWNFDIPRDDGEGHQRADESGEIPVQSIVNSNLEILATSGKMKIEFYDGPSITWRHRGNPFSNETQVKHEEGRSVLDFRSRGGGKLTVKVPRQIKTSAKFDLGKLTIVRPTQEGQYTMHCGKLVFVYDDPSPVFVEARVSQGKCEPIPSALQKGNNESAPVRLETSLGKICFQSSSLFE